MRTVRHSSQRAAAKRSPYKLPIVVAGHLPRRPAVAVSSLPAGVDGAEASSSWAPRVRAPGASWVARVPAPGFFGAAAAAVAGCCTVAACESRTPARKIDLTGDGVAETTAYDTVGDGKVDALDTSGDGQVDTVLVDVYRDTPLRYMGYSNEVGEAFRPIIPRLVVPSYALAIAYVLADTADKARRARDLSVAASGSADTRRVLEQAGDCLVWQLLASVFVPGAVIHQVVHVFGRFIKTVPTLPPIIQTWGATLVGLATIPFIIHPIDHAVDYVLDNSLRTLYTKADATKEVGNVVGRLDLTGDGVAETTAYDTVGDGKADALDTTGDGRIDTKLRPATKL